MLPPLPARSHRCSVSRFNVKLYISITNYWFLRVALFTDKNTKLLKKNVYMILFILLLPTRVSNGRVFLLRVT